MVYVVLIIAGVGAGRKGHKAYRCDDTRAIRPYQPRLVLRLENVCDPDHVMLWNTLRDAYHKTDLGLDRLFNPCCRDWRWNEDGAGVRAGLFNRVCDTGEDRLPEMLSAGLLRVCATDDVGAIFYGLLSVKAALHIVSSAQLGVSALAKEGDW